MNSAKRGAVYGFKLQSLDMVCIGKCYIAHVVISYVPQTLQTALGS